MKEIATFQGNSKHTERKEFEIEGVSYMRFNQYKNIYFKRKYKRVLCADVFCGTGKNDVGGEIVDGSPMRLLNGYFKSKNNFLDFNFWFSDIRKQACIALETLIAHTFGIGAKANAISAADAINILGGILHQEKDTFLFLILDPNGPKDFPKFEMEDLISSFSNRIDVIPYISATTINRCIGARNKARMQFKGWLGQIENFDQGFISALCANGRKGWIRKPIENDPQRWTMIPTFGCMHPRNDWTKQGYIDLESEIGKEVVKFYCGGLSQ